MEEKNEVSWTAMISGCVAAYNYKIAFDCFLEMQLEGVKPNRVTCIEVLPACAEVGFAKQGKEIHAYAFRHGFCSDMRFSSALVDLYGKHEDTLHLAKLIFELATTKDVVMWSSMITSFAQNADGAKESVSNRMERGSAEKMQQYKFNGCEAALSFSPNAYWLTHNSQQLYLFSLESKLHLHIISSLGN
ncbi:hypothetical protein RJ639_004078 [Escallonia herrerae]|uniref:Pentatricopeptide repeat-containing protein n=1 Tax=Escallonia herrerae TaxID=1293975 RepID=A0AA88W5Z0_9ASTE|nr:hypothetical protein RJ639_004078 [Escallonia herrerae]